MVASLVGPFLLSSCSPSNMMRCLTCTPCLDGTEVSPEVCAKPTVRALAHDLDELEELIEKYGSVVAKQPDVWGQAHLTKHREEFEKQMAAELGNFNFTLQGTVSESDQAYFADAFALSAAASGKAAGPGPACSASPTSAAPQHPRGPAAGAADDTTSASA